MAISTRCSCSPALASLEGIAGGNGGEQREMRGTTTTLRRGRPQATGDVAPSAQKRVREQGTVGSSERRSG